MQVQLNTTDPHHIVYRGQTGTFINLDPVNSVVLGPSQGEAAIPSSPINYIVGPLNSVALDDRVDRWALALSGTPSVAFMENVDLWSPSPAQIQQQLQPNILAASGLATGGGSSTTIITFGAASRIWAIAFGFTVGSTPSFVPSTIANSQVSSVPGPGILLSRGLILEATSQVQTTAAELNPSSPIPVPAGSAVKVTNSAFASGVGGQADVTVLYSTP